MVITNISDMDKFFDLIDSVEGKIELVTKEGDCLNLKSKLSQYVAFAKVFADDSIEEIELRVEDPVAQQKFINFMLEGNK